MGGKKTWHGEGWDKSPPWSLWRGARQSRQAHWEEDWQASRRPNHRFPAYDRGGEAPISVIKETRTAAPDRDYTLVQRVQHAVNLARKSAGKVARLQKERDQKVAQWTQYEKDLKESYQRERKRHLHAVQTLEHDIAEALAASETDQRIMQTAADACFLRPPAEQDGSWEALMAEQDDPTVPPFTRDMWEFMQTAMRQRTGDGPSTRPPPQTRNEPDVEMPPAPAPVPMEASQSHPTMRRPPMQTDTMPKGYAAASPGHQFRAEPYPTGSPLPTHMTVEPKETGDNSGVATSAHKPGPHRSPTQALPTRGNIKDTTKAPPEKAPVNGPTFQEKLDARRASATAEAKHSAMQPFRQHAQPVPPIPPEPGPPQGPEPPISIPDEDGPQAWLHPANTTTVGARQAGGFEYDLDLLLQVVVSISRITLSFVDFMSFFCASFREPVLLHYLVMPGHLSVLSYPSIIAQGARPHCAVLLDVTRVGGACQALTLPIDIGLREFLERISMLINVDVEAEQVNVWVGPTTQPASYGGQLSITHGTLITVTQSHVRAPAIFYAEGLFGLGRDWTRLDHVPKPARAHCMAVCHSRGIHPVVLAFFPRYFKEDIALQVTKSSREEATVIIVDNLPVLDLDGEPCPQTAVVLPKKPEQCQNETQAQSTAPTVAYLLDVRLHDLESGDLIAVLPADRPLPPVRTLEVLLGGGGRKELQGDRTFLHVAHGEVLRFCFVADRPSSEPSGVAGSSEGPDDQESDDSEDSEDSDPDSDHDTQGPTAESPVRGGSPANRERSRSPKPMAVLGLSHTATPESRPQLQPMLQKSADLLVAALPCACEVFMRNTDLHSILAGGPLPLAGLFKAAYTPKGHAFQIRGGPTTQPPVRTAKLLREPESRTASHGHHMQDLRRVTELLGGQWLASTRRFLPDWLLQDALGPHTQPAPANVDLLVHFAVLKIDYDAEFYAIGVTLPATLAEARAALQVERPQGLQELFPSLLPVLPQPLRGTACHMASPAWIPGLQGACFDTSRVDGRIFASHIPDYVSRHELLALAGFDATFDLAVWLGTEPLQLTSEVAGFQPPALALCSAGLPANPTAVAGGLSVELPAQCFSPARRLRPQCAQGLFCQVRCDRADGYACLPPGRVIKVTYASTQDMFQPPLSSQVTGPSRSGDTHEDAQDTESSANSDFNDLVEASLRASEAIAAETDTTGVNLTCFLYASDYVPYMLDITAPLPMHQDDFLHHLQQQRVDDFVVFFPWLCPVYPQPDPTYVTLLAIPDWQTVGVPVLISLLGPDARIFAIYLPAVIRRDDVLHLAKVGTEAGHRVFLRDVPWPLQGQDPVNVEAGDLITVCPPDWTYTPGMPLTDILQWAYGWTFPDGPPGQSPAGTWLLTDQLDMHAHVRLPSGVISHSLLAASTGTDLQTLAIAMARPAIANHAYAARTSDDVLIAADPEPRDPLTHVPYILDQRPTLLPLGVRWAHHGRVDVASLHAIIAARCPAGFCVRIYGGETSVGHGNHFRTVHPGTVLSVEFHPLRVGGEATLPGDDDDPSATNSVDQRRTAVWCRVKCIWPGCRYDSTHQPQERQRSQTTWHAHGTSQTQAGHGLHKAPRRPASVLVRPSIVPACVIWWLLLPVAQAARPTDDIVWASPGGYDHMWPLASRIDAQPTGPQGGTSVPVCAAHSLHDPRLGRPIPTPCRSKSLLPSGSKASPGVGPTLFEEALWRPGCQAFFMAATLVDTLLEHFVHSQATAVLSSASTNSPPVVVLADCIAPTPHQQACLALRDILPLPAFDGHADWLDNDLDTLVQWDRLSTALKNQFLNIDKWHDFENQSPDCWRGLQALHLYTDGSARVMPTDVLPCSWAFTVWCIHTSGTFFLGGSAFTSAAPSQPYHVGEIHEDSLTGELLAMLWAFAWLAQYGPVYQVPVTVHYDANSVGMGAFGAWRPPSYARQADRPTLPELIVSLRQYVEVLLPLAHRHVSGHSGVLGNELADSMAKKARAAPDTAERCLPVWPAQLYQHQFWAWAWTLAKTTHDLPTLYAMESEAHRLRQLPRTTEVAPAMGLRTVQPPRANVVFHLVCVSFNVLTLRDKPVGQHTEAGMRFPGRRAVLLQELAHHSPTFVGLQETRLPDTATLPDGDYFMFNAAATDRGQLGCALWVTRTRPYATSGTTKFYFQEHHFAVVGFSHRHISVAVDAPHLKILVMVAHCPSLHNHPRHVVEQFWQGRLEELRRRRAGAEFVILVDANAELGSIQTDAVGGFQPTDETEAGALFHDFLLRAGALLPSTLPDCHDGSGVTWRSALGHGHRLDYIVAPNTWRSFGLRSSELPGFEALQLREDHTPVKLVVEFCRQASDQPYTDARRRAVRPLPAADQETARSRSLLLYGLPTAPWHATVDQQYACFVQAWTAAGTDMTTQTQPAPVQPFLTNDTLQLVQCCKALREYLHVEARERQKRLLMVAFAAFIHAWEGTAFTEQADRLNYLQGLVTEVTLQDLRNPTSLYKAVRRAFPAARSSRRSALRPLPAVIDTDGTLAATPFDKAECWRKHFGQQEAGVTADQTSYIAAFNSLPPVDLPSLDMSSVPNMPALESTLLQLKNLKAAGPDGISPDLLKLAPPAAARHLMPIFLKASLSIREPIEFRGGTLICLAKRVGAALQCQHYRSILISSVPAKVLHRHWRTQLLPAHARTKPPLQAGALGGVGIEAISLTARTFQAMHASTHRLWSIIFVDVQAAFYRVVRESLYRTPDDDASLLQVLHAMKLPPAAIPELRDTLASMATLAELGATPQVRAAIQDAMQGDPAADILFALSFSVFLRRVQETLRDQGLAPELGQPPCDHPWTHPDTCPDPADLNLGAPAWADDFFLPQQGRDRMTLLARTRSTMEHTLGMATSIGMKLTFAPDKTAALLPSGHDWHRLASLIDNKHASTGLTVRDPLTKEDHVLPFVQAYKHLGGILTASTTTRPDILHRQARAMGVVKPLRRQLFGSAAVPIQTRRSLLGALALSKLVHTSAALILPNALAQRNWDKAYLQVLRALLPRKGPADHQHSYLALLAARAPPPPLALAKARAAFLVQLTVHGPLVLRQLLILHWRWHAASSWLAQLSTDIDLVAMYCPDAVAPIQGARPVESLLDSLVEDPRWWLGQVKKAVKQAQVHLERWRLLKSKGAVSLRLAPPSAADLPYQCGHCGAAFALRKHLGAHQAKSHGIWSPARHFALDTYCHACHRWFGTVRQVQTHLKRSGTCLLRLAHLFPPLTKVQVRQVEAPELAISKRLQQGHWTAYKAVTQTAQVLGPLTPTAEERLGHVDFYSEDARRSDYELCIVLTKADNSVPSQLERFASLVREALRREGSDLALRATIFACSSMTKLGKDTLWRKIWSAVGGEASTIADLGAGPDNAERYRKTEFGLEEKQ
ncbi:unnamed protein product [Symbiodinium sp. KB8]|nr:unnamed protein product [Symbiodinium sp. KB8]